MDPTTLAQQQPNRVFLSSTSVDLQAERMAVRGALREFAELQENAMEEFYSRPERPLAECLDEVRRSRIYVGIIGGRYGSICPGFEESFTELEYRHALATGKACFIFLKAKETASPPEPESSVRKLEAFRSLLQSSHVCKEFSTPEELRIAVKASLSNYLQRPDFYAPKLTGPARVYHFLLTLCREADLRELCVKMGIVTYADLAGAEREAKITSLLEEVRKAKKAGALRQELKLKFGGEIGWDILFADDREWRPPLSAWRRQWQHFRTASLRFQIATGAIIAVLLLILAYNILPYPAQREIKKTLRIWPPAAVVPDLGWAEEFDPGEDRKTWLQQEEWHTVGSKFDPQKPGLALPGKSFGVWFPYGRPASVKLYDFDFESLASVLNGTRAAWLLRGSSDSSEGYVLELNLLNSSIYARVFARSAGREIPLLGGLKGNQLAVGPCCTPSDNLHIWATLRQKELTFWVKREPADANNYFPTQKLATIRDGTFGFGAVGVLQTDAASTMHVTSLWIYPVGSVKERN